MKCIILILTIWFSASCTSISTKIMNENENENENEKVSSEVPAVETLTEALARAQKNNDYRLLVTSGRNMTIPGVKASEYQALLALCGKKYVTGVGDVITSETQRIVRKQRIEYMRLYNEQIIQICHKGPTE